MLDYAKLVLHSAAAATAGSGGKIDATRLHEIEPNRLRLWRRLVAHLASVCPELAPDQLATLLIVGHEEMNEHGDPSRLIAVANGLSLLVTSRVAQNDCQKVAVDMRDENGESLRHQGS